MNKCLGDLRKPSRKALNSVVQGVLVLLVLFGSSSAWAFFNLGQDTELSNDESTQIIKLLETFSNGCSLTKGVSADAISVVRGLASAVRSAENDPRCKSLSGLVTSLDSTTLQAQSLIPQVNDSYVNEIEIQLSSLQRKKEEITTLLTQTTDPTEISELRSELYRVRIEIAGTMSEAKDTAVNDQQIRKAQALRLLLGSTQQAVNQIIANESCWVGQPSLLQQVAGVGSTLGASAALTTVSSERAVLLSAGLGILSTVVDFFERLSKAKKLAQFDLALGSTAITCAMEKMNDVYCSAQDTLNAVKQVGANYYDSKKDPVWQGVGLLEKEIPVLLAWLQKVKSGGSAGTIEDAEKQANIELREVNLINSQRIFEGYYRDAKLRYDIDRRFEIVINLSLVSFYRLCASNGSNGGPNMENPLCSGDYQYIPYQLIGLTKTQQLAVQNMFQNISFSSITVDTLVAAGIKEAPSITLDTVRVQFQKLFDRKREEFDIEKRLTLGQDLTLIFDEAMKKNYALANPVTAESALENLMTFLKPREDREQDDLQLDLRQQVMRSVEMILNQIRLVSKKQTTNQQAKEVIFNVADLKFGTSFLGDRLERLVRTDLERLVRDPAQVDDVTRLPLLAANDVISELRKYYQASSLQEMQESSTNAQLIMVRTIDPFIRLFANAMVRVFNDFDNIQRRVGGEGATQALALKTKLCFYFLGATRTQKFFLDECEGLTAKSVLGIQTVPFSKTMFSAPLESRACLYRNFIMKNRIYEKRRSSNLVLDPSFQKMIQQF
jgi:hypothetical protein